MIPKYRKQFNQEFSEEKYKELKEILKQKRYRTRIQNFRKSDISYQRI
jgi:serine protease inhibitor